MILEGASQVRIPGRNFPVRARVEKINGFSAHADRDELLKWITGFRENPKKIFVIHGEKNTSRQFAQTLKGTVGSEITVPEYLQKYQL